MACLYVVYLASSLVCYLLRRLRRCHSTLVSLISRSRECYATCRFADVGVVVVPAVTNDYQQLPLRVGGRKLAGQIIVGWGISVYGKRSCEGVVMCHVWVVAYRLAKQIVPGSASFGG